MPFSTWISKNSFCYTIIAVVTFLVWGQTIGYDFVWDDHLFITRNNSVYSLKNIPAMFYSLDAQSAMPDLCKLFRPLRTVLYAVFHALGGHSAPLPWIFHLANVIWHMGTAMLLFSVANLLFSRTTTNTDSAGARTFALLFAIAFATHPVTSEVVCWAKSLDDIMAAVFVLASLRELLRWNGTVSSYWRALFYFVLAAYSKESAVPFALLVFFLFRRFHNLSWSQVVKLGSGFLAAAFVYAVHRHLVMGQSSQIAPLSGTYGQTLVDMFPVLISYVRLLLGIPPFRIDYSFLSGGHGVLSAEVITGFLLFALFLAVLTLLAREKGFSLLTFGLVWIGLFFLPVSNIIPMMQYMAERFLYLPLIGFLFVITAILLKVCRLALANIVLAMAICVWTPLTWMREQIWHDELTLFVQSSIQGPWTKRLEKNALIAIFKLPALRVVFPEYATTGKLTMAETIPASEVQPAIDALLGAQRIFPNSELVSTTLGLTYAKVSKLPEALSMLETATRQSPGDPRVWLHLAIVRMANNEPEKALAASEKALASDANYIPALDLQLKILRGKGDLPRALDCAEKLKTLLPGNADYAEQARKLRLSLEAQTTAPKK